MAAEVLAQGGAGVTVYDAMPSAGRKFLMAGRGGLNLTHSEPLPAFLARYGEAMPHLAAAIDAFPPQALRDWSEALGQPTFVGSSGRVFPKAFKASPLLRAWLRRLDSWACNSRCATAGPAGTRRAVSVFKHRTDQREVEARATVLALGGASWPRLGSDGAWAETLAAKGVTISPLRPANSGFTVAWSDIFRDRFEGQPLKGIALTFGAHSVRGEAIVTRTGIEGGAIYALSAELREAIVSAGQATLHIALRPDLEIEGPHRTVVGTKRQAIPLELAAQGRASVARRDRTAAGGGEGIRRVAVVAVAGRSRRPDQRRADPIERRRADRARDLDRGRHAFDELDADFMIRRLPGVFAAGEMLDWEAPTGGYLLQASFATGAAAGRGALKWLEIVGWVAAKRSAVNSCVCGADR